MDRHDGIDVGHRGSERGILASRLAVGFAQGLAAWLLTRRGGWSETYPSLHTALSLVATALPLILLAGIGRMRVVTLLAWSVAASGIAAAAGVYAVWRDPSAASGGFGVVLSAELGALLYVAHHLIEPADEARGWRAPYPMLVDGAWRHAFQLALSLGFVGVLWGTLQLGAALFDLIGIGAVGRVVREGWFALPVLGVGFAGAVQLTDVRPGMIAGVRMVALTLLAWLLVLAAALLAAFVLALLWTGLAPLWKTGHSAALLLGAAALLIVLLNAAYQDGRDSDALPAAIRWSGRLAAVLLLPLVGLATWSLVLRIEQYGLTPERVYGFAAASAGLVYALGYLWAALRRGPWMKPLEAVNVVASLVLCALMSLLLSPLLDPARLSVDDQMRRLADGRIPAAALDVTLFRYHGGRFGREALDRLAGSSDPVLAARARDAMPSSMRPPRPRGPAFANARILPEGQVLPQDFRAQTWNTKLVGVADCLVDDTPCDIYVMDLDHDGSPDLIVKGSGLPDLFVRDPGGRWVVRGYWDDAGCADAEAAFKAGRIAPIAPEMPDLEAGGLRLHFHDRGNCVPVRPR